jgi:hypothetical protein
LLLAVDLDGSSAYQLEVSPLAASQAVALPLILHLLHPASDEDGSIHQQTSLPMDAQFDLVMFTSAVQMNIA